MGKRCYRVSKEEAMDYVFGYSIGNDVTCRDVQLRTGQWLAGKAMPTFGPLGPCIVTRDEYQPGNKVIRSYVNGILKQEGNTDEMIFSIPACRMNEFITQFRIANKRSKMSEKKLTLRLDFERPPFYNELFALWGLEQGEDWRQS